MKNIIVTAFALLIGFIGSASALAGGAPGAGATGGGTGSIATISKAQQALRQGYEKCVVDTKRGAGFDACIDKVNAQVKLENTKAMRL